MSHERRREDKTWIKEHWRPMMAWQYFVICLFDFMIAPIGRAAIAVYTHADFANMAQWQPLTLQGGGLYHIAMGAIVGITSWQKSQERIQGTNANSYGGYNNQQYNQNYNQSYQNQQYQPHLPPRRQTQVAPSGPEPEL